MKNPVLYKRLLTVVAASVMASTIAAVPAHAIDGPIGIPTPPLPGKPCPGGAPFCVPDFPSEVKAGIRLRILPSDFAARSKEAAALAESEDELGDDAGEQSDELPGEIEGDDDTEGDGEDAPAKATVMAAAAAAKKKILKVKTKKQETNYWCAPASGRVALSALVSRPPSQASLAIRMETSTDGTYPSSIPAALNYYQRKNTYVRSSALSLRSYRASVQASIRQSAPTIPSVDMDDLPWYRAGIRGGHAVAIYGYSTGKKYSNMWVYDPWDNKRHTSIKSAVMYNAGINDHELVW